MGSIASISCRWPNTEEVGGLNLIEALGAIDLLAGDDLTLANLGNMSQATEGDLVEVAGQLRRSVAGELQHLETPRFWVGTDSVNIFRLLLQLMNVVEQLAAATSSHIHDNGPVAGNSATMTEQSQQAKQLASQLSPIIE